MYVWEIEIEVSVLWKIFLLLTSTGDWNDINVAPSNREQNTSGMIHSEDALNGVRTSNTWQSSPYRDYKGENVKEARFVTPHCEEARLWIVQAWITQLFHCKLTIPVFTS